MVKDIPLQGDQEQISPRRQVLKHGYLRCLGAAHARARSGIDRYVRNHNDPWLIEYVVAGAGWVRRGDQEYRLVAGDCYVFGPGAPGSYRPDDQDPWEKLFIEIDGTFADSLAAAYDLSKRFYYPQLRIALQMKNILRLLSHHGNHFQRDFPINVHRLISSIGLSQDLNTESMGDYLESHIKNEFQLQEMADHFKYSKNHLVRLFKKQYGTTPYEYLLQRRVEQAIWAIVHTSLSVKRIAAELQFSDNKHLSSTLKKRSGKSPREWRSN